MSAIKVAGGFRLSDELLADYFMWMNVNQSLRIHFASVLFNDTPSPFDPAFMCEGLQSGVWDHELDALGIYRCDECGQYR